MFLTAPDYVGPPPRGGWRPVWLALVVLVLAACTVQPPRQPTDCTEVADVRLDSFPFAVATEQSILAWIENQFAITPEGVRIRPTNVGIEYLDWESERKAFTVSLSDQGERVASVSAKWRTQAPSIGDVLRCLGAPQSYRAYYALNPDAGPWTNLELWYPERGLQVEAVVERRATGFDEGLSVTNMLYAEPGTAQELAARFWVVEVNSDAYRRILETLADWPGAMTDIKINAHD
jgi:hypothetical protein